MAIENCGIIVKSTGGLYTVEKKDGTHEECRAKGAFRHSGITPLAGDRVVFEKADGKEGFITVIEQRRNRLPDAYDSNISDIAKELGIHKQTLAKIIDILELELKLIVTDRAYRVKTDNNEFRTLPTIFANAYKREDKYLLDTGEGYSRSEIELKAENIKRYYQDYKIDKRKRKNKKKKGEIDGEQ